jgi:hypothetical protein
MTAIKLMAMVAVLHVKKRRVFLSVSRFQMEKT